MGNKRKKKFTQLVAVAHFLIFQMHFSKLQNLILIQMEMELQAYLMQFFLNEMGNKRKKIWEIKRRKNVRNSSQLHTFSFFKCKF